MAKEHDDKLETCEPFTVRGTRGPYTVEVVRTERLGWEYRSKGITAWYPDYGPGARMYTAQSAAEACELARRDAQYIIDHAPEGL